MDILYGHSILVNVDESKALESMAVRDYPVCVCGCVSVWLLHHAKMAAHAYKSQRNIHRSVSCSMHESVTTLDSASLELFWKTNLLLLNKF